MNTDVKILISAVDKGVKSTITGINSALKKTSTAGKLFSEALGGGQKAANSLISSLKSLATAYVGLRGLTKITGMMRKSEESFFSLSDAVEAANREFANTGSLDYWNKAISELSGTLQIYSESSLRNAIARTIDMTKNLGLSADQIKELVRIAGDLGAGQMDIAESLEILTGALAGSSKQAKAFGLTLTESYIKSWYEANKTTKLAWEELSYAEKAQVKYQIILEQTTAKTGRAAEYAKTFSGALAVVKAEIEKAVTGSKSMADAMTKLARVLVENKSAIAATIGKIVELVGNIIEWTIKHKELVAGLLETGAAIAIFLKLTATVKALGLSFAYLTGMSIITFLTKLRDGFAIAAASTGTLALAFKGTLAMATAVAILQIANLIKALWDWRSAAKGVKEAQDDLTRQKAFSAAQAAPDLAKASAALGFVIKDVEQLLKLVDEGKIKHDAATGEWIAGEGKRAAATRATTDAIKEFGQKATEAYKLAISEAKKHADKILELDKEIKDSQLSAQDRIREITRKGLTDEQQWADKRLEAEQKVSAAKEALRIKDYELAKKLNMQAQDLYADLAREVTKKTLTGESMVVKTIGETKQIAISGIQATSNFIKQVNLEEEKYHAAVQSQAEAAAGKIKEILDLINQAAASKINISAEGLTAISAEIDQLVASLKNAKVDIPVDANPILFQQKVLKLSEGVFTTITVPVDADPKKAQDKLANLKEDGDGLEIMPKVDADTDAAEAALDQIRESLAAIKDKTVTVTIIKIIREVHEKALGGLVRTFALGGKLFGYGGGDKIKGSLEAGEFILRKEAVRHYGNWLFDAYNNMKIPKNHAVQAVSAMSAHSFVKDKSAPEVTLRFLGPNREEARVTSERDEAQKLIRLLQRFGVNFA